MDKRQTNAPGAISSGDSADELTQARRGRAEVQAKLEQGGDEEDLAYWRKVIAMWDDHIQRLEARHGREGAVQTEHCA